MLGTITNNHIQPSCAKKDIAFKGGINRRVTRCLNMSEDGMHRLVSAYSHTNGIVGHFPSDMVKVLRASNASGKLGERIKRFQTGFTEAADILKDTAKISEAEAVLEKTAHETGFIPKDGSVKLSRVGEGVFGVGYKVEFVNSEGEQIIHPKLLKVFKPEEEIFIGHNIVKEFINDKDNVREFFEMLQQRLKRLSPEIKKMMYTLGIDVKKILKCAPSKFIENISKIMSMKPAENIHGATPELNAGLYFKNFINRIDDSNYVRLHFGNPQKKYFVSEFVEDVQQVKKKVNISDYGISHPDTFNMGGFHHNITTTGVVFDYGGVSAEQPELCDKVIRSFYAKIMKQKTPEARKKMIEKLLQNVAEGKYPDSEKVFEALRLAEARITN